MTTGRVKWFNEQKGFGFIIPDGLELDVFVHFSVIQAGGYRTLIEGEKVYFEMTRGDKGAHAAAVQRIGGGMLLPAYGPPMAQTIQRMGQGHTAQGGRPPLQKESRPAEEWERGCFLRPIG